MISCEKDNNEEEKYKPYKLHLVLQTYRSELVEDEYYDAWGNLQTFTYKSYYPDIAYKYDLNTYENDELDINFPANITVIKEADDMFRVIFNTIDKDVSCKWNNLTVVIKLKGALKWSKSIITKECGKARIGATIIQNSNQTLE